MLLPALVLAAAGGCSAGRPASLGELRAGDALRAIHRSSPNREVTRYQLLRQVNGWIEVSALDGGAPVRIALADLWRLEVARGRARSKGLLAGATAGMVSGIVGGMVCRAKCDYGEGAEYFAPLVAFAAFGTSGAVAGAVFAPVRWVELRLR